MSSFDSIASIHQMVPESGIPLFSERYSEIKRNCESLLKESPRRVADWVRIKRSDAWSHIGSEQDSKPSIDDKELIATVRSLKEACQTGLSAQDKIIETANQLQLRIDSIEGMPELAKEIKQTAEQAEALAYVGQQVAKIKGRARSKVQEGLREIDTANRQIERHAEISTLREACYDWESAMSTMKRARSILNDLPRFPKGYQNSIARSLVKSDQDKIQQMISRISPHVSEARTELAKAERQERTALGRTQRRIGRLLDRASTSRIGREVAVSFKTMVLGTKMFYDLMDMDASSDIMSWAMSYEEDMGKLMSEMDEVQAMDGWSLTGKNTFIEDAVEKAYERSFED